jgi:hypothetical protein
MFALVRLACRTLGFYSYLLGLEADQVAAHRAFANSQAVVQSGMRV